MSIEGEGGKAPDEGGVMSIEGERTESG